MRQISCATALVPLLLGCTSGLVDNPKDSFFCISECQALKCSQLCDHIDGRATCLCHEGYKMDMDNGTCIPIGKIRTGRSGG